MHKAILSIVLAGALAFATAAAQGAEPATPDDTARFLAGLPPAAGSPLAALTNSADWQQHARRFDAMFAQEEKYSLAKVRAFSQQQLPDKHHSMLYMFSGPDFLYASSFFPTATTYVLSALEPVGDVPQLAGLPRASVDGSLHNLESSLGTLMNFSFFITKNMKTQLQDGQVFGTLPILYVFLARTGKTIHDVSFVSLDADGNIQPPPAGIRTRQRAESGANGVKIVFSDGTGPNQTLYYFSTNLADDGVKNSGFLQFCDKLGAADSFIKSASYLLHYGSFTRVRNFILARSATVVEDDSGIPLAYFDPKKWKLDPYGRYLGPIGEFPSSYQPAMEELYRNSNPVPLDFGIGYRWKRNESNLLIARKIGPVADDSVINSILTTKSESFGPPDISRGGAAPPETAITGSTGPFWRRDFPRLFGPRWSN
jgi:hypothetical protein